MSENYILKFMRAWLDYYYNHKHEMDKIERLKFLRDYILMGEEFLND